MIVACCVNNFKANKCARTNKATSNYAYKDGHVELQLGAKLALFNTEIIELKPN